VSVLSTEFMESNFPRGDSGDFDCFLGWATQFHFFFIYIGKVNRQDQFGCCDEQIVERFNTGRRRVPSRSVYR